MCATDGAGDGAATSAPSGDGVLDASPSRPPGPTDVEGGRSPPARADGRGGRPLASPDAWVLRRRQGARGEGPRAGRAPWSSAESGTARPGHPVRFGFTCVSAAPASTTAAPTGVDHVSVSPSSRMPAAAAITGTK